MDVFQAIQTRRSIRSYQAKPIEPEKLERVLDAGRLAPSARNMQDWMFVVVQDRLMIRKLAEACNSQSFVAQAPAFIAACSTNPGQSMACGQTRSTVDLSIATAYMILEAWEMGLGTCWLGSFNPEKIKQLLDIPADFEVVAVTPLGYPDGQPAARPRKALQDVVCYEKFNKKT